MGHQGTLIFFCGKMGAGKSTNSKIMTQARNAVLISEDEWLSSLYPNQIISFDDYIKLSAQLKPLLKTHVQNILNAGVNVVMDFPANTKNQRKWFTNLVLEVEAKSELIYLKVNDELCLKQIAKRRVEEPAREKFDTEEMFYHVTKYFEEPDASEVTSFKVVERNV